MVRVGSVRWQGRCAKHPRYNPAIDGPGGIRGGCRRCELLLEIWTQHSKLVRLMREFGTREHVKPKPENDYVERQMSLL
jgi:hypothetical protein